MQVLLERMNGKFTMGQLKSSRKVSFLTAPHDQFQGVGQGMKQTYLWYPLFQVQWDKCNERNHQA
jgi:hypothetical protein